MMINLLPNSPHAVVKLFLSNAWTVALIRDKPSLKHVTAIAYPTFMDQYEEHRQDEKLIEQGPVDVDDCGALDYVDEVRKRPPPVLPT